MDSSQVAIFFKSHLSIASLNKAPHVRLILISIKVHRAQALETNKKTTPRSNQQNSPRRYRTGHSYSLLWDQSGTLHGRGGSSLRATRESLLAHIVCGRV